MNRQEPDEHGNSNETKFRRSFTREFNLNAITFFETTDVVRRGQIKNISIHEACRILKIDRKTLRDWIKQKEKILHSGKGSRKVFTSHHTKPKFPELEDRLYGEFQEKRAAGRQISMGWLIRNAKKMHREMYPKPGQDYQFAASNGC